MKMPRDFIIAST
jgi:hypothetical protein